MADFEDKAVPQPDIEARKGRRFDSPKLTQPARYLGRMMIFLALVVLACVVLNVALVGAFLANPILNGVILGVLVMGILFTLAQVTRLRPEVKWLREVRRSERQGKPSGHPTLLAPVASVMREHEGDVRLNAISMRALLDSIASRLDESREISRYTISLLIFLGLLGTFWGLLQTITAIGGTIEGMSVGASNIQTMFEELKAGLREPLSGMGTAFSSSLFGLAGSVILGFLDLQAGQAQNRFYNELEEWLGSMTRMGSTGTGVSLGDGDASVPAYVSALLEQTADSVDNLQRTFARSEASREKANAALIALSEKLTELVETMRRGASEGGLDEASREHLRSLDNQVAQLDTRLEANRDKLMDELRGEIKLLARTIAASAGRQQDG